MALMANRQLYPTTTTSFIASMQSSAVSKLHVTRHLHVFRYGYKPLPLKKPNFFAPYNTITNSNSSNQPQNPDKKSNFVFKSKNTKLGSPGEKPSSQSNPSLGLSTSSSWLDKWDDTHQRKGQKSPQAVGNYRNTENLSYSDDESSSDGGSTMEKIVEKLKKFGYIDKVDEQSREMVGAGRGIEKGSIEDIFYVEEGMLPNSRGGFSPDSPLGVESVFGGDGEVRFPWERRNEEEHGGSVRQKSRTSLAELTVPELELKRLRNLAFRTKNKTRIGGGGVTQAVVESIHDKWKSSEVVKLKIDGPSALNMKRMHEILERKTGGLVIWRSGSSVALYRGVSYEVPSERLGRKMHDKKEIPRESSTAMGTSRRGTTELSPLNEVHAPQADAVRTVEEREFAEPLQEVKYEDEIDKLLDGLGPRYTDWPGCDPLPVDADLLPGVVPGYEPPFRILPYGVRSTLGGKEATALRRLARVLPPHFALGRSRQHQGLAVAMIKLWERSSIAKIALKRGVQLTTSERMSEDIKTLTGGILLSRNKDFLVFYRGKNFLSSDVAEALLEKERSAKTMQDEEEEARLRASMLVTPSIEITDESGIAGSLGETLDAHARWGKRLDDSDKEKVMREAEAERHANLVRKLEKKLAFADRKLKKAERTLSKVEAFLNPAELGTDTESITEEERFMFRKLGLRMKAFLLLGRRGIFDGTVENMHLHWKYRELVKIILKAKSFEQVKKVALSLEAESGGVLVSVDKISKGYAIIVFRGKDYKRPPALRPKNLLTKRKALARSIELQRYEALLNHISTLQTRVDKLRSEIDHMSIVKDHGDNELYDRLDSAYSTEDDDDNEEEGDDAYPVTYDDDSNDEEEGINKPIYNFNLETTFPYDFQDQESENEPETHDELPVSSVSCTETNGKGKGDSRVTSI